MPAPPPMPDPTPGEPDPIPKEHKANDAKKDAQGAKEGKDAKAAKSPPKLLIQTTKAKPAQEAPDEPLPVPTPSPSPTPETPTPTTLGEVTATTRGRSGHAARGRQRDLSHHARRLRHHRLPPTRAGPSIIEENGTLLVGTGSEGVIYQVKPSEEETIALAKVDPKQVMALLPTRDGRIIMGLANVGGSPR
jgi:hypothetical protein